MLVAGIVAIVRVLSNAGGAAHPPTENLSVFGYHQPAQLFLFGIVVGGVAPLRLSVLLAGARRNASRGSAARRAASRFHREMAFKNRARDTRLEHQQHVDTAPDPMMNSGEGSLRRRRRTHAINNG